MKSNSDVPAELADDIAKGKNQLKALGLDKQKAQLCILLDVSSSMQDSYHFFKDEKGNNKVQQAINKILALAFSLDDNQQIDIIPFGDKAYPPITVNRKNFKDATKLVLKSIGSEKDLNMDKLLLNLKGATNYADAIRKLRKIYFNDDKFRQSIQPSNKLPVFAIKITDGDHNREEKEAVKQYMSASYQNVFIKTFGLMGAELSEEAANKRFKFLHDMDKSKHEDSVALDDKPVIEKPSSGWNLFSLSKKPKEIKPDRFCIDNCNFVKVVDPNTITLEQIIDEFPQWLEKAYECGISTVKPSIEIEKSLKLSK